MMPPPPPPPGAVPVTLGREQCPWVTDARSGGYLCCQERADHDGPHATFAGWEVGFKGWFPAPYIRRLNASGGGVIAPTHAAADHLRRMRR